MMLTIKLAYRNILRQRRRSLLTGLSIGGGYILFSFVLSLLDGSYGNAIEFFTSDHTGHIQIHQGDYETRPKIHKNIKTNADILSVLDSQKSITAYAPRIFSPALAYAEDKTVPTTVQGIDVTLEPTVSLVAEKIAEGNFFDNSANADGYFKAMVGSTIADQLNINIGDELVLISQGADGSIANDIYIVSAIVGSRTSWDRMMVYLPLPVAQEFLTLHGRAHQYVIQLEDGSINQLVSEQLQSKLPGLNVQPWQEIEVSFYNAMKQDQEGNKITMGFIVFIVFIGVLNTVLMSVMERTKEFGVLKAIGSRPSTLVRLICIETSILTAMSIAVGIIIALPMNYWLSQVGFSLPEPIDMGGVVMQSMQGTMNFSNFAIPTVFMFATAILISIPPGLRAARILPRDALGGH